jgi:hypothetical protein
MNILIIPEDFRKDQHMLGPIIRAMMTYLGREQARVDVCRDPLLGGIEQALEPENLEFIVKSNPMVDLFLLCVDRDGEQGRRDILNAREDLFRGRIKGGDGAFLSENAWQEIEVWLLAGHDLLPGWRWNQIREHRDPKEAYYLVLARERGVANEDSQGRKVLGLEAAKRYRRIRQMCREDIQVLERRLDEWINNEAFLRWQEALDSL